MNFFTKKNFIFKLIVCICLFLTLLNFMGSSRVYAGDGSGSGGVLINPICKLLASLGDGVMRVLQKAIMGTEATISLDNSDPNWWETIKENWGKIALMVVGITIAVFIIRTGDRWSSFGCGWTMVDS